MRDTNNCAQNACLQSLNRFGLPRCGDTRPNFVAILRFVISSYTGN